ncbi:MAG: hypothetical protein ACTIC1_06680, partial [Brevibacterium sp.]
TSCFFLPKTGPMVLRAPQWRGSRSSHSSKTVLKQRPTLLFDGPEMMTSDNESGNRPASGALSCRSPAPAHGTWANSSIKSNNLVSFPMRSKLIRFFIIL